MTHHIGILGGTFDPIHIGHVILAIRAREQLSLDEVLLIPNERSPFKTDAPIAGFAHRLAMTELALRGLHGITASDVDGRRGGISYMIDTLGALAASRPDTSFTLLLGYDALCEFPSWRSSDDILKLASLAAVARDGESIAKAPVTARGIDMPRIDVSASDIRERIAQGLPIDCLTPSPVIAYIRKHRLYAPGG